MAHIAGHTDDDVVAPPVPNIDQVAGTESSLSNWAGDYVTDMLGKGQALSELPYQGYDGPLTAGASELQDQAFGGIAGLTLPDGYGDAADMNTDVFNTAGDISMYNANDIGTEMWNNQYATDYMNPFIEQALDPQLAEMNRQNQIQKLLDNAKLTQAGAYGGSRQAIMNSESNDNMMRLMAELTGTGYQNAYESAGRMFTSDMGRKLDADRASEQSRQFGAGLGLQGLNTQLNAARGLTDATNAGLSAERDIFGDQLNAGDIQRGITAEGIAADKTQFEEERDYPYKAVQYQHSLLDGMPLAAQNTTYTQPSWLSQFGESSGGIMQLLQSFGFGGNSNLSDSDIDAILGAEQFSFT